ncbi:MAG: hypothetical protein KatS3mg115_2253 [Candidatus Poribacteria bacterium]|nr:MAG: hypothetical protein KatS3mg115_2253 [Candidatus Poribacteria bacterium]
MRKVAVLAEAHYVPIAPHCTMTLLGLTASLHVAASVPLFLIHEGYPERTPADLVRVSWAMGRSRLRLAAGGGRVLASRWDESVAERLSRERGVSLAEALSRRRLGRRLLRRPWSFKGKGAPGPGIS